MDEQPDPPPFRLSPLTAALLIPALCLAVVATLWLGTHAKGDPRPVAITSPTAAPTPPGPTPWPQVWPAEDGGTVDALSAYGVLTLAPPTNAPPQYTAILAPNASVPLPERPDPRIATVQRIRPLDAQTVDGIAARLGSFAQPTAGPGGTLTWPDALVRYTPATSTITAGLNSKDGLLPLVPRDADTAERATQAWLVQRGLVDPMAPVAAVQLSNGESASFATWQVTVPHLAGQSDATEITMVVSASGLADTLTIAHPIVLGAAPYPIVDWEKAWAQVQAGRARDIDQVGDAAPGPLHLTIDGVALTSRIVQTRNGPFIIPVYAFLDTANRTALYWPALDPAQYTFG